jgi:ABC-2 type transport system permease protein
MKRIVSLTTTLLRDWIRNREAVFFAAFFPLLLLLIFGFVFGGGATEFTVAVQNNDLQETDGEPTELSAELVAAMEAADPITVEHVDSELNLSETEQLEETTGYQRVLVIPEGFDERVRAESGRVRMAVMRDTIARAESNLSDSDRESVERGMAALEEQGANGTANGSVELALLTTPDDEAAAPVASVLDSIIATFNDRSIGVQRPTVGLSAEERGDESLGAADYFLPAFIVAMILINCVMTVPSAVAQFKRDGTLKRLAATPLRRHEWILANVLQQSILAVVLTGVMIAVAWVVFGVRAIPGVFSVALIVLGAVAFTALGMIVGTLIREPGSAISLGGGIALPLMFISGIFWELDLMPPTVQSIAEFSPVTHYHRSLRQLMILDSTDGVALTFGVLCLLAVIFLGGAVTLTRWTEFD